MYRIIGVALIRFETTNKILDTVLYGGIEVCQVKELQSLSLERQRNLTPQKQRVARLKNTPFCKAADMNSASQEFRRKTWQTSQL